MNDFRLADAIYGSLGSQSNAAVAAFDDKNIENASAIINEWTTDTNACLLTHHLQDTTSLVDDDMLYVCTLDEQIGYGTFTFDAEAELPVDNN